jgi:predicted O-methyltransferase YrrM
VPIIAVAAEPVPLIERVRMETFACRAVHCGTVRPFEQPALLAGIASEVARTRLLEVGCGHGYATLWLAEATDVPIDVIEVDPVHAARARANFAEAGLSERVTLYEAAASDVLPTLSGPYDLALYEIWPLVLPDLVDIERLLRVGGVLVSSLLGEAQVQPPEEGWSTRLVGNNLTMSTKR